MNNNRFTIVNVIVSILFASFLIFIFWPMCFGSYCLAIIWTGNIETDLFSAGIFGIIFLIPLFMGINGVIKYLRGYGLSKFGSKESYNINATLGKKRELLNSSIFAILLSMSIITVTIWDIILRLRNGI